MDRITNPSTTPPLPPTCRNNNPGSQSTQRARVFPQTQRKGIPCPRQARRRVSGCQTAVQKVDPGRERPPACRLVHTKQSRQHYERNRGTQHHQSEKQSIHTTEHFDPLLLQLSVIRPSVMVALVPKPHACRGAVCVEERPESLRHAKQTRKQPAAGREYDQMLFTGS